MTSSQGETVSEYHTVNYGTPQESCLGPLIFLIFVNDMRLHLTDVDSVQFADDTTILFGHRNDNYSSIVLNENWKLLVTGLEPINSHLMLIKVCSSCLTEQASEESINSNWETAS